MKKIFVEYYQNIVVRLFTCLAIVLLVHSCGDSLTEENFVDLEPPTDNPAIDLRLHGTDYTLNIFEPTKLQYTIGDGTTRIYSAVYSMEDQSWEVHSNASTFNIHPNDFTPGPHKLKLNLVVSTGTNSIADNLGFEKYQIHKEWDVITDGREAPSLQPVVSVSKDSILVIKWPKADHYNFQYYEISASTGFRFIDKKISNINDTTFCDPLYAGEGYSFSVDCITGNSYGNSPRIDIPMEAPQLYIQEIGYEKLKISWERSRYKAKYKLLIAGYETEYFATSADTSFVMPQPGLGNRIKLELRTKSQNEVWEDDSYGSLITSYLSYSMGHQILQRQLIHYAFNREEKVFYTNDGNDVVCFDVNSFNKNKTLKDLDNEGLFACPTNSSRVATLSRNKIYVFEDSRLENPIEIPYENTTFSNLDHFLFTDNGKIAYAKTKTSTYHLVDIDSKQELLQIPIDDYPIYSKWACISTSQDANYMSVGTENGLKIYHLANKANEIYSDTRNYRSVYFNPLNASELYLTFNDNQILEVRNPLDFSLIKTINLETKMVIENIDPASNKILLTNYKRLFIYDLTTGELVFSMPGERYYNYLFDGLLLTESGFLLDIKEEL